MKGMSCERFPLSLYAFRTEAVHVGAAQSLHRQTTLITLINNPNNPNNSDNSPKQPMKVMLSRCTFSDRPKAVITLRRAKERSARKSKRKRVYVRDSDIIRVIGVIGVVRVIRVIRVVPVIKT
jgi:hypothetical protein